MTKKTLFRSGVLAGALLAGIQAAHAATITSYFVRKGLEYQQDSAAAPTPQSSPAAFLARLTGDGSTISEVDFSTPSQIFPFVPSIDTQGDPVDRFEFTLPGSGTDDLDTYMPNGNYSFTVDSTTVAPITLSAGSYPTAVPQVMNYVAAHSIDPSKDFALNITPFTGAGAGDTIELEIHDSNNNILSLKSVPASGTSITIPAGTLQTAQTYNSYLRFVHNVAVNTTAIPGATGSAGYFAETSFDIATAGTGGGSTGGGTGGGTGPTVLNVTPSNGQTGVALNSTVNFVFSTAMAPQQSITWTGVNGANFSYQWFGGQALIATYAGGFPANTTIGYTLNGSSTVPTGFKDTSGNSLAAYSGSFTTGSSGGSTGGSTGGGNSDCLTTNHVPTGVGSASVFKEVFFTQTDNSAPVPATSNAEGIGPAEAAAFYSPATNQTVTAVKITTPTGSTLTATNYSGTEFIAFQGFPSAQAMDTLLPPGTYTINATGAGTAQITVGTASTFSVPQIKNLTDLLSLDPTKAFTLNFAPFTGASGQFDQIQIQIDADGNTNHFYAPDYCIPRTLANTATSVVIPANTFKAGDKLTGRISFSRFTVTSNSIPNTILNSGLLASTSFGFTVGGSTGGSNPNWNAPVVGPNGITFSVTGTTGSTLIIQKSTDLKTWTTVTTLPIVNGSASYTVNPKTSGDKAAFFRAQVQ